MLQRRLRLRNVRSNLHTAPSSSKSDVTHTVEQSHARQILNLPPAQRGMIIDALKEGSTVRAIADFFADQGWLTVTEKSFIQYINAFRRVYPELLRDNNKQRTLELTVDPRQPQLEEEVVIEQLLRFQKRRLAIGHEFEDRTGFLNKDLHRDVQATAALVETLATLRGRLKGEAGRPRKDAVPMSAEAGDALRKADNSEQAQDRLVSLTASLIPLLKKRQADAA
jgi:hypothetical protein